MKSGMRECGRERPGYVADEIYRSLNLIVARGGHFAKFPPCAYRDMCTAGGI